jgi:glycine/D-amino acid oxidase-like deaminating enzyme
LISNLYTITGHGSKGWTLGFGSCELLADLIEGKPTKVIIKGMTTFKKLVVPD